MTLIEKIIEKLIIEERRLVASGEPQEIAFQLAFLILSNEEVKLYHEHNSKKYFPN